MKKGKAWLLLLVLVMGLLGSLGTAGAAGNAVQVGQKATDFSAPLLDGSSFKLSDSLGKVVFVNVWASWCGPCASEVPDLQKLAEAYPDTLVVLGLNNQESKATVSQFVTANSLTYPQALDTDGTLNNTVFPSQYIPYTIVIDPTGVVTQAVTGSQSYDTFQSWYQSAASRLSPTPAPTAAASPSTASSPMSTLGALTCTPQAGTLNVDLQWTDQADGLRYTVTVTPAGSPRSYLTETVTAKKYTVQNLLPDTEFTFTVTESSSKKSVSKTLTTGSVGKYSEFGAVPNMANFIYVKNADFLKAEYNIRKAKYTKIKTVKATTMPAAFTDAYYLMYLKWTYAKSSPDHTTSMAYFLQTPDNELYCYAVDEFFTSTPSPQYYWYWYVDVTDIVSAYQTDHSSFQKGKYSLWVYYNALFFRKSEFTIK